jgi:hypothetical protein
MKDGENPIYCKCLDSIDVFPEMKLRGLLFSKQNSVSQFPHSFICERFIYSQDWSAYFAVAKVADDPRNI